MPKVQRSPPSTPVPEPAAATTKQQVLSLSSPDVYKNPESTNVTSRNKRLRANTTPEKERHTFQDKIMSMLTTWKEEQDQKLNRLSSDIAEVKEQNKKIQKTNSEIEKSIDFINKEYESMRQLIEKLDKERFDQRTYISELEKKVDDLQRRSRPSTIEIRNVPCRDNEHPSDLEHIVLETCQTIKANVKQSDLRDIYRLPGKKGMSRPIVAEFQTVPTKIKVIEAARSFNKGRQISEKLNTELIGISGPRLPVYVAEHLPPSLRQLFFEARNYAKTHKYKFCWSQNGKIFLRENEGSKSTAILSMSCLKNLKKST